MWRCVYRTHFSHDDALCCFNLEWKLFDWLDHFYIQFCSNVVSRYNFQSTASVFEIFKLWLLFHLSSICSVSSVGMYLFLNIILVQNDNSQVLHSVPSYKLETPPQKCFRKNQSFTPFEAIPDFDSSAFSLSKYLFPVSLLESKESLFVHQHFPSTKLSQKFSSTFFEIRPINNENRSRE